MQVDPGGSKGPGDLKGLGGRKTKGEQKGAGDSNKSGGLQRSGSFSRSGGSRKPRELRKDRVAQPGDCKGTGTRYWKSKKPGRTPTVRGLKKYGDRKGPGDSERSGWFKNERCFRKPTSRLP